MPKKVDKTSISRRFFKINDAWKEDSPTVEFMGVSQKVLSDKMAAIQIKQSALNDLRTQEKMIEEAINDDFADLDTTMVNVGSGVRGDPNYGDDSPLYGAMGFVRKSERKSGLTRKPKTPKKS